MSAPLVFRSASHECFVGAAMFLMSVAVATYGCMIGNHSFFFVTAIWLAVATWTASRLYRITIDLDQGRLTRQRGSYVWKTQTEYPLTEFRAVAWVRRLRRLAAWRPLHLVMVCAQGFGLDLGDERDWRISKKSGFELAKALHEPFIDASEGFGYYFNDVAELAQLALDHKKAKASRSLAGEIPPTANQRGSLRAPRK